jgi:hypothetical protein
MFSIKPSQDLLSIDHLEQSSFLQIHSAFNELTPLRSNSSLPEVSGIATAANAIAAFNVNTQQITGTLRADTFTISQNAIRTIISGNGNVDFGNGYRDLL